MVPSKHTVISYNTIKGATFVAENLAEILGQRIEWIATHEIRPFIGGGVSANSKFVPQALFAIFVPHIHTQSCIVQLLHTYRNVI